MIATDLLNGARVRLTALKAGDVPTLARWQENSEFMRLFDSRPCHPRTEAALAQWLEESHKSNNHFLFAIRLVDGDRLLGYVELEDIEWSHRVGWVAIGIGEPTYWGQGYGHEAMQLTLAFAFRELNLHRVQLTVFSYNERAIAMYEKAGFRREGTFREFLQRDGRRYDMYLYGLLRHEWEASSR